MVEQIMRYQLNYYSLGTPVSPLVETVDELKVAIEMNEVCQALSYANERECMSYIPFHKSAVKNDELKSKYLEYIRSNKITKLDAIKLRDLDLHCPVDYKSRNGFKDLMEDIADFKQEQPDRATMILDAGTQYYVAMQSFDIVSTSLTGNDADVDGGARHPRAPMNMRWWDERKMWPRPTNHDAPAPSPDHCPYCRLTPNFEIEDKILNRRRRGHRLFDLNDDATSLSLGIRSKKAGLTMRRRVANAEFSYSNDLILSP